MVRTLFAASTYTIDPTKTGIPAIGPDTLLNGLLSTVYWAGGVAAVIVIIVAGILYATSNGDAAKVQRAKNAILYAVIGLVVIVMAFMITRFIIGGIA
jgi:hypothetical protein